MWKIAEHDCADLDMCACDRTLLFDSVTDSESPVRSSLGVCVSASAMRAISDSHEICLSDLGCGILSDTFLFFLWYFY